MRGLIVSAALAGVACASAASAHHSVSMFDIGKPIWVKGTVVRFEPINPHIVLALEQRTEDGQVRRWTVEGSGLNAFNRSGLRADFLQPGDVIEVCGFAWKAEVAAQTPPPGGLSRPDLTGHVLQMPDGHLQFFGGYGKIENCIRPGDSIRQWVNFLEANGRAHGSWCDRRLSASAPSLAPTGFVDEVNRQLSTACGE
jgi:hypothetical protein